MMRTSLLATGLIVLAAAWLGPLPGLAPEAFAAHMTMHVLVVAVAAPLIALGLADTRADPVPRAPWLFAALPASLVEFLVIWGWHSPALHHLARHSAWGLATEQGSFLAVGLLLWLSAFGGGAAVRAGRAAAGILGLLLTSMHMTLLGALLTLAPRVLYPHGETALALLSPLEDQRLGGIIMLVGGGVAYLAGGLALMGGLLKERPAGDRAGAP
jgi:putative membrane protein